MLPCLDVVADCTCSNVLLSIMLVLHSTRVHKASSTQMCIAAAYHRRGHVNKFVLTYEVEHLVTIHQGPSLKRAGSEEVSLRHLGMPICTCNIWHTTEL